MNSQQNDADLLRQAKALIDKPQKWCRGSLARGTRRCAVGAVNMVTGRSGEQWDDGTWERLMQALEAQSGNETIPDFNDEHRHTEVMDLFDRAIAAEESR